ncbi:unnamed protein product [Pseudo-nitzschia multistriata]|uniref:DUF6824 domain-containing protein n=1 Tax=Pseudo-nitzschia multistriata TaxID=183589 RepID=A0A448ZBH4_9STRA|nr:unnamed protein product [Pseudo-nitzschia multistriata]
MTPVPRSTDNRNTHMHHHHHHHLMNSQPIQHQQESVTRSRLSEDRTSCGLTNIHSDVGGSSPHGTKEGRVPFDSNDLEGVVKSNSVSASTGPPITIVTAPQTTLAAASEESLVRNPVAGSSVINSCGKKLVDVVTPPHTARPQNDETNVCNQFVVGSTSLSGVISTISPEEQQPPPTTILDSLKKSSPTVGTTALKKISIITSTDNKNYNGLLGAERPCLASHDRPAAIVTPSMPSTTDLGASAREFQAALVTNNTNLTIHCTGGDRLLSSTADSSFRPNTTNTNVGSKRKLSSTAAPPASEANSLSVDTRKGAFPDNVTTNTPLSRRRDSLPMGLRNKKMKATDCLLFAASLLEQDERAEGLMAARSEVNSSTASALSVAAHCSPPPYTTSVATPIAKTKPKTKPMKKMVCEKIERSLRETTEKLKQQEQREEEDGDAEYKPNEADVLCGRGGKVNKHPGNIVYRKVVEYNKSYYQSVHKKHRILVSQSIVKAIINYGGRFMGQNNKEWSEIGFKRAVQKTSQALRERSNTSDVLQGGIQQLVAVTTEVIKK